MAGAVAELLHKARTAHLHEVHLLEERIDELEDEVAYLKYDPEAREQARVWGQGRERLADVIHHLLHATGVYDLADLKDAAHAAGLETT